MIIQALAETVLIGKLEEDKEEAVIFGMSLPYKLLLV